MTSITIIIIFAVVFVRGHGCSRTIIIGRTTTAVMATAETAGSTVSIGLLLPCLAVDVIYGGTIVLLLIRSAEDMHNLAMDPNYHLFRRTLNDGDVCQ